MGLLTPTNWFAENVGKLDITIDDVSYANTAKNVQISTEVDNKNFFKFSNKKTTGITIASNPRIKPNRLKEIKWNVDKLSATDNFETIKEALDSHSRLGSFTFIWSADVRS